MLTGRRPWASAPPPGCCVPGVWMRAQDAKRCLKQHACPTWVPLARVCAFLRQAGLLPKMLSKLMTELIAVSAAGRDHRLAGDGCPRCKAQSRGPWLRWRSRSQLVRGVAHACFALLRTWRRRTATCPSTSRCRGGGRASARPRSSPAATATSARCAASNCVQLPTPHAHPAQRCIPGQRKAVLALLRFSARATLAAAHSNTYRPGASPLTCVDAAAHLSGPAQPARAHGRAQRL